MCGGTNGSSAKVGEVTINVEEGGKVSENIFGGENQGTGSVGKTTINLNGGTVSKNIYGGENVGSGTVGTSTININKGVVTGDIYGGASGGSGIVEIATINLAGGTVSGSIYGGASGGSAIVKTANININGGTLQGSVYGGGLRSTIGTKETAGKTTLNIVGGTIERSIYGGSRNSTVYGDVVINIGKEATGIDNIVTDSLEIKGNIYGGGNNESASDYIEKLVTGTSTINMDGKGYANFKVNGNIFGSGRYCTVENSSITVKNLGENKNPYEIQSIHRTDVLTLDSSNLEIIGIADSTNLNVEIAFTFNRIGNLKLKNGTTLHLRRGFNQVEEFNSLVDINGKETKASVDIDGGKINSSNVINRVYLYEGVNLIIAKEQYVQNKKLTSYGKVNGMTFLGMYARDRETIELKYDLYDPTTPVYENLFKLGCYAEGIYDQTQAIKVDGFYTNELEVLSDPGSRIIPKYVQVITDEPILQDWIVGMTTYFQEVTMIAKRSKERVYEPIPLVQLNEEGVGYQVTFFSVNSLESGINLVDKSQIPTMAPTPEQANTTFALTMRNADTGWKTQGETGFYTSKDTPIKGTTEYLTDDSGSVPYLDLYLYNSINIDKNSDAGMVSILLMVKEINGKDLTQGGAFRVEITVNIQTVLEELKDFGTESHIDKGKNYDIVTENETHISERSAMTLSTNIYPLGQFKDTDYRALASTCQLPINTQITMIDYVREETPTIYYYEIKDGYDEIRDGKYIYNLSNFVLMGSVSGRRNYDNENSIYAQKGYEEYRFILDFKDAKITEQLRDQTITLEIMDGDTNTSKSEKLNTINFNIYVNRNSELSLRVEKDAENVYEMISEGKLLFDVSNNIIRQTVDGNVVNDTYYDNKRLGMAISLVDTKGNRVPYEKIKGSYLIMDGLMYYPDTTGVIRIYLSDNIVNVDKTIEVNIKGNLLNSGEYRVRIENFASDNGIFYGENGEKQNDTTINVIDLEHGLKVEIEDEDRVMDNNLGVNYNGEATINFDITASDIVNDTNIRMILYRRDATFNTDLSYAQVTYTAVNLSDYVTTPLVHPEDKGLLSSDIYEYLVTTDVKEQGLTQLQLALKDNLITGGYKLVFELYSKDVLLGQVDRHFVITDLINID